MFPESSLLILNAGLKFMWCQQLKTALITRVADLQVKQSPSAREVWDNRAVTGRPRKHIQLGRQLPTLCREGPAPSEGKLQ